MKKKLEAELISIAHRILKLKNRAELDQLRDETLKLYEKLSVLRFVEDNFSDIKPTIGYASAEATLEEVYGIEELPEVKANEVEAEEEKAKAEKDAKKETAKAEAKEDKKKETPKEEEAKPEGDADPEQKVEEYQASEEEEEETEESGEEVTAEESEAVDEDDAEETIEVEEDKTEESEEDTDEEDDEEVEEPFLKVEVEKPAEELKAMEESAAAVFEKEDDSTPEEEEKAADAEVVTIAPDDSKVEDSGLKLDFAFERPAAPDDAAKQKEITFEDYHDYKEPEFVKKDSDSPKQEEAPKEEAAKEEEKPAERDWRDWEPAKEEAPEPVKEEPKAEAPKEEPKQQESAVKGNVASRIEPEKPKGLNDALGKTITLTLNDRIAFEKQLFGGSGEDLNRVLSQLNTFNSYQEAKDFISDLVKPDYNDWQGKEEYEERFMGIVEKKFE